MSSYSVSQKIAGIDRDSSVSSADIGDIVQQTFLGASIRSFNINAGFNASSSSVTIELINDELNKSDSFGIGFGDDVYHNGLADNFQPPVVGSPAFFKFGANFASINQAWYKIFNELYGTDTLIQDILTKNTVGNNHLTFGGIINSYTQNRSIGGNPLFSVSLSDPREILSNVILVLNNYTETVFNNKNILNLYGFLEHNPSDGLKSDLESSAISINPLTKIGTELIGDDTYTFASPAGLLSLPAKFPITGTGFSRRTESGIPFYRVVQSIEALLSYRGQLPQEYIDAKYGNVIDFRGYKYVIDLSALPLDLLPNMYMIDYDNIDILSLIQEVCDVLSCDFTVSLLPIINHPSISWLYNYNEDKISNIKNSEIIAGIIRVDIIDKTSLPDYGAIPRYLSNLQAQGIEVETDNSGFELSNITTDKFIVGAQKLNMYLFHGYKDRDDVEEIKMSMGFSNHLEALDGEQWSLETSMQQQILPFYGFLGKNVATIPRGWGPFQQILLDISELNSRYLGKYYITTEAELRAVLISYDRWVQFLTMFNEIYLGALDKKGSIYDTVVVPRCVFNGEVNFPQVKSLEPIVEDIFDLKLEIEDGVNIQRERAILRQFELLKTQLKGKISDLMFYIIRCSPPYGFPLYYGRASILSPNTATKIPSDTSLETLIQDGIEVYNFLKNLADENFGKKFLVKVPKKCNLNFTNQIETVKAKDLDNSNTPIVQGEFKFDNSWITKGPFGFPPIPINGVNIPQGPDSNHIRTTKFLHYLESDDSFTYTNGALNQNYNPLADKIQYTYDIKQAGYFDENTYPSLTVQQLAPRETSKFINEDGKFSCYVRFDHSDLLDLSKVGDENVSQEIITEAGTIVDLNHNIGNVLDPSRRIFNDTYRQRVLVPLRAGAEAVQTFNEKRLKSIAFVKCSVEEEFVCAPKIVKNITNVYGRDDTQIPQDNFYIYKNYSNYVLPFKVGDSSIINTDFSRSLLSRRTQVIHTELDDTLSIFLFDTIIDPTFNTDNLYVIIKLPDRVLPREITKNFQPALGAGVIDLLHLDRQVVRGVDGFDSPIPIEFSLINQLTVLTIEEAETLSKRIGLGGGTHVFNGKFRPGSNPDILKRYINRKGASNTSRELRQIDVFDPHAQFSINHFPVKDNFAIPERTLNFIADSIIYPNLASIPFQSNERCYGPWNSASKIDNSRNRYANIGGKVEFVKDETLNPWEYGGFENLNKAGILKAQFSNSLLLFAEKGSFTFVGAPSGLSLTKPILTDGPLITSISVSLQDSIKTTVNMEVYSSKFGKLQKHSQDELDRLVRDRLKNQSDKNKFLLFLEREKFKDQFREKSRHYTGLQTISTTYDRIISTVDVSNNQTELDETVFEHSNSVGLHALGALEQYQGYDVDDLETLRSMRRSAGSELSQLFVPYDENSLNKFMPVVPYINTASIQERTS